MYLYFDGASRGNPGRAGIGSILKIDNRIVGKVSKYCGIKTNNQAEYLALIEGMKLLIDKIKNYACSEIVILGDSQLIIRQMKGEYRVKSSKLRKLHLKANNFHKKLIEDGYKISFKYIQRDKNKEADNLANAGIDNNN